MATQEVPRSGYAPDSSRSLPGPSRQPNPLSWEQILDAVDEDRPLTSQEQAEARKDTAALWLMRLFVLGGSVAAIAAAIQQAAR